MINQPHPSYESSLPSWSRIRDVLAGEDAVKAAGERYLPRVQSHSDDEYAAYQQRASFFNATARTAEGYVGLIFRRPPFIKLPDSPKSSSSPFSSAIEKPGSKFENGSSQLSTINSNNHQQVSSLLNKSLLQFLEDADLQGTSFPAYAKTITTEIVSVGRAGSLIDFGSGSEPRAYVSLYRAEQILNWRIERVDGRSVPTLISLHEFGHPVAAKSPAGNQPGDPNPFASDLVEQIRVLKLIDSSTLSPSSLSKSSSLAAPMPGEGGSSIEIPKSKIENPSRAYLVEIWQQKETTSRNRKPEWQLVQTHIPMRFGHPLPLIPFVFHGPNHSRPDIDKTPLTDIIAVNLDHYRLDADYKHGLHFTALPTAWVSGFDKTSVLKIGSTSAWVTEAQGATAGFLEFTGQGLTSFERAMDRDERLMAVLGSRLLENQKRVGETAQAIELRQSGENSILSNIASSASESLTRVLRWVYWWHSTEELPDVISDNQALVRLNTDFSLKGLTSQELQAIVAAWQNGAISRDTMFELFRKGEILPDGRTNEEESSLLGNSLAFPKERPATASGSPASSIHV